MNRHYNLSKEWIQGAIIIDDKRCFYSDYYTTVKHERKFNEIKAKYELEEERDVTIVADSDAGCDRIVQEYYKHELKLEDAIFDEGEIVGFYLDFKCWNGSSSKPNSHIIMLEDEKTHCYYNTHSTWKLVKKM